MNLSNWTIPAVLRHLRELWDRGHDEMDPRDLVRRARHHDAAVVEGLRRVVHLPDLHPTQEQVRELLLAGLDTEGGADLSRLVDERVGGAERAERFFVEVAGFTGNDWRMRAQVAKALIYDACVALERDPAFGDFDAAREFALHFYNTKWAEVYAREDAAEELDAIALHIGLVWAFQALHAMVVHEISPEELAMQSLRKYGHVVCRACLHPVCCCGRIKEGDTTAVDAVAKLPDFEEFDAERLARGGWKKATVTSEMIERITFLDLARSLFHCYDARNAMFGGPLEGPSRQRSEATGEYDGPAWMRETALSGRDVRQSAFFFGSGYEELEEIGDDPTADQARFVVVKEASDAAVSWPPVYANAMGIPWEHVVNVTFGAIEAQISDSP